MKIDKALVLQAKAGDDSAFASLYETVWQDLYKSAFYILGNREDAMDVVSETFLEAYRGIRKLRDETRDRRLCHPPVMLLSFFFLCHTGILAASLLRNKPGCLSSAVSVSTEDGIPHPISARIMTRRKEHA